jgi:hypothetical protein
LGSIDLSEAMERLGDIRMIRAEHPFCDSEHMFIRPSDFLGLELDTRWPEVERVGIYLGSLMP